MVNFWIIEAIKIVVLLGGAWALGLLVLNRGVKVNYTRKVLHFAIFFLPVFLASRFPYEAGLGTTVLGGVSFVVALSLMVRPVRERITFSRIAFAAFDRPEDRPHTLLWLSTQFLASYAVIVPMLIWLDSYDRVSLIYITILIAGIGDGLAEPVGVRFGRHHYATRALFTDRRYTRSLEGSACVFASGLLAIALMAGQMSAAEIWIALAIVPLSMTLAEAWSPHTWDSPFLYLVGGAGTVLTLELAAMTA